MPSFCTIEVVIMQILGDHKYITSYSSALEVVFITDISPCTGYNKIHNKTAITMTHYISLFIALPILILNSRGDKSKLHLSKSFTCLSLISLISFSLHICLCVLVGVWEPIRISSTGIQDQPSPSKILSNAAMFVQSAHAHTLPTLGNVCPHCPKTTSSA